MSSMSRAPHRPPAPRRAGPSWCSAPPRPSPLCVLPAAAPRPALVVLVGRHQARLDADAADLTARGASRGRQHGVGATSATWPDARIPRFADLWSPGSAARRGAARLWRPRRAVRRAGQRARRPAASSTSTSPARPVAPDRRQALTVLVRSGDGRPRTLVVIGSVAGDRGRQSNYVYGAAKAGPRRLRGGAGAPLHGHQRARVRDHGQARLRRHAR